MKNLRDYVYISEMDSDITDLTDKIFEENVKWQKHQWADTLGKDVEGVGAYRGNLDVVYHGDVFTDEKLYQEIFKHITKYLNTDYGKWALEPGMEHLYDIRFNRYRTNTFMAEHVDHIRSIFDGEQKGIPILSCLGLLNDDFTGGEFVLCDEVIPLKKNSMIIWPSVFLYPHKVTRIKSGTRYTFVGWAW